MIKSNKREGERGESRGDKKKKGKKQQLQHFCAEDTRGFFGGGGGGCSALNSATQHKMCRIEK